MARKQKTLAKAIKTTKGTIIPKNTQLSFSVEGKGYYAGEEIDETLIPEEAFEEMDDLLSAGYDDALESINELADKACEGDEEAIASLAAIASDTAGAIAELIEEGTCGKSAIEDGFGDQEVETLETLKDAIDEVCDKFQAANESDEMDMELVEDAVEQFRSIFKK
jgi:DNA-binding protein YbaB